MIVSYTEQEGGSLLALPAMHDRAVSQTPHPDSMALESQLKIRSSESEGISQNVCQLCCCESDDRNVSSGELRFIAALCEQGIDHLRHIHSAHPTKAVHNKTYMYHTQLPSGIRP